MLTSSQSLITLLCSGLCCKLHSLRLCYVVYAITVMMNELTILSVYLKILWCGMPEPRLLPLTHVPLIFLSDVWLTACRVCLIHVRWPKIWHVWYLQYSRPNNAAVSSSSKFATVLSDNSDCRVAVAERLYYNCEFNACYKTCCR